MPESVLVDNDVLLKTCCYRLEMELLQTLGDREISMLGAAKFVLARSLRKLNLKNKDLVDSSFHQLMDRLIVVEPSEAELGLAAEFEEAALIHAVELDAGESQLLAVLAFGSADFMMTGDKRAIHAIEKLAHSFSYTEKIRNRIGCLEQLVMRIIRDFGALQVHRQVCDEQTVDKSLTICFSCYSDLFDEKSIRSGLKSYISNIRSFAGDVLVDSDDLSSVIP